MDDLLLIAIAQVTGPGAGAVPDIISGGAGWIGASLLSGVLGWLMFVHLPAKDKQNAEKDRQIAAMIESRDALVKQLADTHREAVKSLVTDFRESVNEIEKRCSEMDRERRHDFNGQLQMIILHHKEEQSLTSQAIRRDLDELNGVMGDHRQVMAELRNLINEARDKNMQILPRPARPARPGQPPAAPPMPPPAGK